MANEITSTITCSCGLHCRGAEAHVVACRTTDDGITIKLWSDGCITSGINTIVAQGARTDAAVDIYLRAGRMVMDWISVYDFNDVRPMVDAARWAAKRGLDHSAMRARMNRAEPLRPVWTTTQTDRDGKPTEQWWVLPRMRWPGLAVFRSGGEYLLMQRHGRSDTYSPTGFRFSNLEKLAAHLRSEGSVYT